MIVGEKREQKERVYSKKKEGRFLWGLLRWLRGGIGAEKERELRA